MPIFITPDDTMFQGNPIIFKETIRGLEEAGYIKRAEGYYWKDDGRIVETVKPDHVCRVEIKR